MGTWAAATLSGQSQVRGRAWAPHARSLTQPRLRSCNCSSSLMIKTQVYSKSQHLPSFSSTRLLAGKPQGGGGGGGSWPLASPNSWIWEGGREGHRRQESVREGTGAPVTQHGALEFGGVQMWILSQISIFLRWRLIPGTLAFVQSSRKHSHLPTVLGLARQLQQRL